MHSRQLGSAHHSVTLMNWMTLSNARLCPSPHRREISIMTCRVWDTICVLQSKGELHLQMPASADKQATSTKWVLPSNIQSRQPSNMQSHLQAFSDSRLGPGGIPSNRSSRPIFGPVPQKHPTDQPPDSAPPKKSARFGERHPIAHTKNAVAG